MFPTVTAAPDPNSVEYARDSEPCSRISERTLWRTIPPIRLLKTAQKTINGGVGGRGHGRLEQRQTRYLFPPRASLLGISSTDTSLESELNDKPPCHTTSPLNPPPVRTLLQPNFLHLRRQSSTAASTLPPPPRRAKGARRLQREDYRSLQEKRRKKIAHLRQYATSEKRAPSSST